MLSLAHLKNFHYRDVVTPCGLVGSKYRPNG